MMNDTVREELQSKITSGNLPRIARPEPPRAAANQMPSRPAIITPPAAGMAKRQVTAALNPPKTSPTLVEFQNKNTTVPDWRLQLQNAVQQRKGGQSPTSKQEHSFPTNGGAALKAEIVQPVTETVPVQEISDPRVANAMRRIDRSRKVFSAETAVKRPSPPQVPPRAFPFDVVENTARPAVRSAAMPNPQPKPKLVVPTPPPELKLDTNKLPPLPALPGKIQRVETIPAHAPESIPELRHTELEKVPVVAAERIQIKAEHPEIDEQYFEADDAEIDDLAPISMRFGAGLFDLIIGGFISMAILAPFAMRAGESSSLSSVLLVLGTLSVVMFFYMTISLGFLGKTLGMRLFSLELVDATENEYPTLQQAAVNSSVFLLSLGFLGAGFLTVLFNEEKRAVHDLLSGTILVRDF